MAASVGTQKDRVLFGFNTGLKQRDCRSMFPSEKGMHSHFWLQPMVQSALLMDAEYFFELFLLVVQQVSEDFLQALHAVLAAWVFGFSRNAGAMPRLFLHSYAESAVVSWWDLAFQGRS